MRPPELGEPCPTFIGRTLTRERYAFDTAGGRYVILSFFPSAGWDVAARFLAGIDAMAARLDDHDLTFFGVTIDPTDEKEGRLRDHPRGRRFFIDADRSISARFGVCTPPGQDGPVKHGPVTFVLDPRMRVIARLPLSDAQVHLSALTEFLDRLPPLAPAGPAIEQAPALVVPHVFEPELCARLVACYDQGTPEPSGFMIERDGRTVGVLDPNHKRRRDVTIEDMELRALIRDRFNRRLLPEIGKAYQFHATRIERYLVACYESAEKGHFGAHRDNTTKGTAHRQFAVSVALTTDHEGGEVSFPEYGRRLFRAPLGGAVVFSCSMLHKVRPVTRGRRLVFLPFLYDTRMAQVRRDNRQFLDETPRDPADAPSAVAAG